MADWPARWRTWCRNALSFTKPPRGADLHVASAAGAFEQTTAAGWVGRLEVFYFGSGQDVPAGFWAPKYGPKPGEAGCKAPPSMVKAAAAAAQRRAAG